MIDCATAVARAGWLVCLLATLAACGQSEPLSQGGPQLKVYRHAMDQAPTGLDPLHSTNIYASTVLVNVYDTLYAYKYLARPYALKPNLADGWPVVSADGLRYRIAIKQGVRFADDAAFPGGRGRELTAEDVVYSLKRHFVPQNLSQGAWLWAGRIAGLAEWETAGSDLSREVAGLRASERYVVEILLTQPYPQLLDTLAQAFASIVPREAVERYGREFSVRPVGSGPFRLVSYNSARVILEPNRHYRREPVDLAAEGYDPQQHGHLGLQAIAGRSPPFLDRLEIHFIQEASAAWESFSKRGEVQFTSLPPERARLVLASRSPVTLEPEYAARYHMTASVEAAVFYDAFNMKFAGFGAGSDPQETRRNHALRCAIRKGFDWEQQRQTLFSGLAEVFPGMLMPAVPEFDSQLSRDSINRDVAGARALLADHGWNADNLPELVYGTFSTIRARLFFEQFRAWMQEIGYPREKIVLKQFASVGALERAWKRSELPFIVKGYGLDYPDALNILQLFYGPNAAPRSNDANYRNPEFDRLYEEASVLQPSNERTALIRRMNQILIDDCVAISGLARMRVYLWHKNVIALPDRQIVGGFFLKYVDLTSPARDSGV